MRKSITRDISYASSAKTRPGRAMIRVVENMTGRVSLIRRAKGYEAAVEAGDDFWRVMPERYGLSLDLISGSLDDIPRSGPLVVVSNHPYGILDGLMMGHILSGLRQDFRIIAHGVFRRAEALNNVILPISFDETKEATRLNLQTRAQAIDYLGQGGAIGIFPGGTVSTAATPFARPLDPVWRNFTAKMIAKTDATVLPLYFDGHNSRLFQIASHMNYALRMALLIKEFKARVDTKVRIAVGQPISPARIAPLKSDPKALMDFLRRSTYDLSKEPAANAGYGFEFEQKYRA
ncbi:MAG TPA: lysophospholipid acyltransferase family protein [Paracoccaceae bacterium]|nr:lysophospholipid acyltransferase family protein [Paracoccaceae bacterium]